MRLKDIIIVPASLALWGLAVILWGGDPLLGERTAGKPVPERKIMAFPHTTGTPQVPLPPLDVQVPARTETATFALG